MLFNSFNFIIFFITTVVIYFALPFRLRWVFLLAASCVFYMAWRAELIALIFVSVFVNYFAALRIDAASGQRAGKRWLAAAVLIDFGLLFVFKYLVFINQTFIWFLGDAHPLTNFNIILPLGISFYTFQAVGYVIDVYRRATSPEKNYFRLALFITFFPQLVAGPIERSSGLLPQLFEKRDFSLKNLSDGLKMMATGFFKKVVIADRAAFVVNTVYNSPQYHGFFSYVTATLLFAVQIYCDFSGYSEIARGAAKVLGIDLVVNFETPYLSKSVKEFWRRWHISLSGWFRDYVYFPLGGNKKGRRREYLNLMATFLLSGLWHGANWTFLVFGALNGLYQVAGGVKNRIIGCGKDFKGRSFQTRTKGRFAFGTARPCVPGNRFANVLRVIFTFSLICVSWIFFRANTLEDAFYIVTHFFWGVREGMTRQGLYDILNGLGISLFELISLLAAIVFLGIAEGLCGKRPVNEALGETNALVRYSFYAVIVSSILLLGVFSSGGEFIYFQF